MTAETLDRSRSELYRHQNRLMIAGAGLVVLSVWSFLKGVMLYTLAKSQVMKLMGDIPDTEVGDDVIYGLVAGMILFLLAIDALIKIYVGRCARAEGLGRTKKGLYVFLAWAIAIVNSLGIIASLYELAHWDQNNLKEGMIGDTIASVLLDTVTLCILIWLIQSARYVRRERKSRGDD